MQKRQDFCPRRSTSSGLRAPGYKLDQGQGPATDHQPLSHFTARNLYGIIGINPNGIKRGLDRKRGSGTPFNKSNLWAQFQM